MQLSRRASAVQGSVTLAINAKAKALKAEGYDIIGFGAGEPDFSTPQYIIDSAIHALQSGKTRYTPAAGVPALRQAVCDRLRKDIGLTYKPSQIVISNGAKHALFNALQAVCNPGDEVILAAPYWVSYPELIKMADATPVFVPTVAQEGFTLHIEAIENAITDKTKAIIINSPSNPTGCVLSRECLEKIAEIAIKHDLIIISDEIYSSLVYDNAEHISIASLGADIYERTIVVNGMSKSYAMTGWRIGYTACSEQIAQIIANYQSHATSNANSVAQEASITALTQENDDLPKMVSEFSHRREYMVKYLNSINGINVIMPKGAFYVFADISSLFGKKHNGKVISGSLDFVAALLEDSLVAVVPGLPFGADGFIRLSYATSMNNIERGLPRIKAFVEGLKC